ncbi:MAG: ABC transporter permease, partial [Actinomycetes bacterium]
MSRAIAAANRAQSAAFLLIFRYVFGGAIGTGPIDYVDFLIPGFVTTGILFSGLGAAADVAADREQGFIDRLRSLPIPRSAILSGRALADTAVLVWGLVITTAIGFAVGFRIHGSVPDALAAFGLIVVFGFAFEWLFIALGMMGNNAQAAHGFALMVFPLTFVSSAYVPRAIDAGMAASRRPAPADHLRGRRRTRAHPRATGPGHARTRRRLLRRQVVAVGRRD